MTAAEKELIVNTAKEQIDAVIAEANRVILGKETVIRLAITCMIARGHLLIEDMPGVGKTTLAHLVANELGVKLHATSGPAIERKDLAGILSNLEPRDVLFIGCAQVLALIPGTSRSGTAHATRALAPGPGGRHLQYTSTVPSQPRPSRWLGPRRRPHDGQKNAVDPKV